MKHDLFALCEERGRKVNELADVLAKQPGHHPRSRQVLAEVEQLLDNWADATFADQTLSLERKFSNS